MRNQRLSNPRDIVSQCITRKQGPRLKFQRRLDHLLIKVRYLDCEGTNMRGLARRNRIDHTPPRARCVRRICLFGVFDRGVVVTSVTQISLNFICVAFDCAQGESASWLQQIQARPDFITRDRRARSRRDSDTDAGNYDLSLHDEAHPNWQRAVRTCSRIVDLDPG